MQACCCRDSCVCRSYSMLFLFLCDCLGWNEESLMTIFMIILEGNARSWYEGFPASILSSLKYFHTTFHEHFKYQYPSLLLLQDCCRHDKEFIENLKDIYGDD